MLSAGSFMRLHTFCQTVQNRVFECEPDKTMERPSIAIFVLAFGILALIFLISGFATRGWIIYEMTINDSDFLELPQVTLKVTFGLWKGEMCVKSQCSEYSFSKTSGMIVYDKGTY